MRNWFFFATASEKKLRQRTIGIHGIVGNYPRPSWRQSWHAGDGDCPWPSRCPLADPAAGFRGTNLVRGSNLGTPKTENSTDLTHYFFGWTQIHFRKKYSFLGAWGGKRHDGPLFLGFGGGMVGLPPWIRQCRYHSGHAGNCPWPSQHKREGVLLKTVPVPQDIK